MQEAGALPKHRFTETQSSVCFQHNGWPLPALGSWPLDLPLSFSLCSLSFEPLQGLRPSYLGVLVVQISAAKPVQFFLLNLSPSPAVCRLLTPCPAVSKGGFPPSMSFPPENLCYQWAMKMRCFVRLTSSVFSVPLWQASLGIFIRPAPPKYPPPLPGASSQSVFIRAIRVQLDRKNDLKR